MYPDALFDLGKEKKNKSSFFTILHSHWICIQNSKDKNNEHDRRDFGHDRRKKYGGYIGFSALLEVEKLNFWVYIIYSMCEISNPNLNSEPERICQ